MMGGLDYSTCKKRRRLSSCAEVKVIERRMRKAMPTKGNNAIQINHIIWYGNLNRTLHSPPVHLL